MTWTARAWCFPYDGVLPGGFPPLLESLPDPLWWTVYWRDGFILAPHPPDGIEHTVAGSAFGMQGELRWRVDGDDVRVVALGQDLDSSSWAGGPAPEATLERLEAADELAWYLSGTYDGDQQAWVDGRFPRPFHYEVGHLRPASGARLRVRAVELLDAGAPAFHVLHAVVLAPPDDDEEDR